MTLSIWSTEFRHNETIPVLYTCDGEDISPPLAWSGVPEQVKSMALIVEDPDAPDPAAPKITWVHWVLYNIPTDASGLTENISASSLPGDTQEGLNSWGRTGYGGPCPPKGRHRYFFKLYGLDTSLTDLGQPGKEQLERAFAGHVVVRAELIGTYARS